MYTTCDIYIQLYVRGELTSTRPAGSNTVSHMVAICVTAVFISWARERKKEFPSSLLAAGFLAVSCCGSVTRKLLKRSYGLKNVTVGDKLHPNQREDAEP